MTTSTRRRLRANSAVSRPTVPAADHQDRPAGDALAEAPDVGAEHLGIGMQDAVGGDRSHLRDEDAEDRIDARPAAGSARRGTGRRCGRSCGRRSCATTSPVAKRRRAAFGDARDLHVAEERHGIVARSARRRRRRRGPSSQREWR